MALVLLSLAACGRGKNPQPLDLGEQLGQGLGAPDPTIAVVPEKCERLSLEEERLIASPGTTISDKIKLIDNFLVRKKQVACPGVVEDLNTRLSKIKSQSTMVDVVNKRKSLLRLRHSKDAVQLAFDSPEAPIPLGRLWAMVKDQDITIKNNTDGTITAQGYVFYRDRALFLSNTVEGSTTQTPQGVAESTKHLMATFEKVNSNTKKAKTVESPNLSTESGALIQRIREKESATIQEIDSRKEEDRKQTFEWTDKEMLLSCGASQAIKDLQNKGRMSGITVVVNNLKTSQNSSSPTEDGGFSYEGTSKALYFESPITSKSMDGPSIELSFLVYMLKKENLVRNLNPVSTTPKALPKREKRYRFSFDQSSYQWLNAQLTSIRSCLVDQKIATEDASLSSIRSFIFLEYLRDHLGNLVPKSI